MVVVRVRARAVCIVCVMCVWGEVCLGGDMFAAAGRDDSQSFGTLSPRLKNKEFTFDVRHARARA